MVFGVRDPMRIARADRSPLTEEPVFVRVSYFMVLYKRVSYFMVLYKRSHKTASIACRTVVEPQMNGPCVFWPLWLVLCPHPLLPRGSVGAVAR